LWHNALSLFNSSRAATAAHALQTQPEGEIDMARKTFSRLTLILLTPALLLCGPVTRPADADAQTATDSVRLTIEGTVLDCAGNPVTIAGTVHLVTHTTVSDSGQAVVVSHLNQNLQGTSADGTQHVMNQQLQETITVDTTDGFPATQTFVIHSNLNNNDPNVPQLHIRALVHATFNANGELTAAQVELKEECEGS
jgi:hypothetical protein